MRPEISKIEPQFALPGGEIRVFGKGLMDGFTYPPRVWFGKEEGSIVFGSENQITVGVPDEATGPLSVTTRDSQADSADGEANASDEFDVVIAQSIAENLHPVANPAVDRDGNIYVTFSGSRGQSVPVSIYKIDTEYNVTQFATGIMNATGLAVDSAGFVYVSSRMDGTVYRVSEDQTVSTYAQGMGVATGIAFDHEHNLYVGDRSGTIFKIADDRQIYVFATLEPSVSAYHLAFGANGYLYVTGPTTSSNEAVYEIDPHGSVSVFYQGLGRPQGLAFDFEGNLYVAASLHGRRGIIKITEQREASVVVSGTDLVGLAFAPNSSVVLATHGAVHYLPWEISGRVLVAD